jgi:hypothetical protein
VPTRVKKEASMHVKEVKDEPVEMPVEMSVPEED